MLSARDVEEALRDRILRGAHALPSVRTVPFPCISVCQR
jgi:hypothetical protein